MDNVCRLGKKKDGLGIARCLGWYGLPSVKLNRWLGSTGSEGDA